MSSASESNAELFALEYFGEQTAYLAQSPQFFKQMAQSAGFGKIFEIGDVFRADPSFTSRHATEFTSIDAEISWIDSHEDVARMQEELLAFAIGAVTDKHGAEIEELFGVKVTAPTLPFPRIPLAEATRDRRSPRLRDPPHRRRPRPGGRAPDLGARRGGVTATTSCSSPTTRTRSARSTTCATTRPGSPRATTCSTTASRSRPAPSASTASTSSIEQAKQKGLEPEHLEFYFDFFRYGVPPHGGFGMGLARVLMLMLGESSIREVTYLFRGPTRLAPVIASRERGLPRRSFNFRDTGGTPLAAAA